MNPTARFIVFAPLGADPTNPMIIGALPVPGCFEPSDEMVDVAERLGFDIFFMTGKPDALPPVFFEKGARIMDRLSLLRSTPLN